MSEPTTQPEFKVYLACCQSVILNEIAQKECTQRQIAQTYAMSIRSEQENGEAIDWKVVNSAIMERWSRSGLERIKNMAWSGKCWEPKKSRAKAAGKDVAQ